MNSHIPRLIHMCWKDKNILEHTSPMIKNGIRNLASMNPDWKLTIHEDADIDEYLKDNLAPEDFKLFENCGVVEKTDIWRLIKMYSEGGLYSDLDRYHSMGLEDILKDETKCVLPTTLDLDFSHTFMMSAPQNPIFLEAINLLLSRRREGHTHVYFLGPQTYMHAVTKVLTGEMIDSNPGADVFNNLRKIISDVPFLETYRENPPADLITHWSNDITAEEFERQKRELYAEFGIKHWTGEW